MGGSASRQVGRTLARAPKPAATSHPPVEPAFEQKFRDDAMRANQSVDYEALERKDESLDNMLNKLAGAIRDKHVQIQDPRTPPSRSAATPSRREGSMPTFAIRAMMEENDLMQSRGQTLDVEDLAQRYKLNPELLRTLLQHACLPHIFKTASSDGVTAVAERPQWFKRRTGL